MREKEKPINRDTFRFLARKPAPPHLRKVKRAVWLTAENAERIRLLSRNKQISYSKALEMLIDTEDAAKICAPVKIDWKARLKEAHESAATKALKGGLIRQKRGH